MKPNYYLPLVLALSLSACSSLSNSSDQSLFISENKDSAKSLEVPPDLTQLPVFASKPGSTSINAANIAGTSALLPIVPNMSIQKDGATRWLKIDQQSPEMVWPAIIAFVKDLGFTIKNEDPKAGTIETNWAESRANVGADPLRVMLGNIGLSSLVSTPERDMFRIRLERSENGTEVFLTHRGMYETYTNEAKSETSWQPRPSDPSLEASVLTRLMVQLGMPKTQADAAMKDATIATDPNSLIQGEQLVIADPFDRAWRRVGLALDRMGLSVQDRNRQAGVYFVKPALSDSISAPSTSLLSNLAFWKSKDPNVQLASEYQVKLHSEGNRTQIQFLNKDGTPVSADTFKKFAPILAQELK